MTEDLKDRFQATQDVKLGGGQHSGYEGAV